MSADESVGQGEGYHIEITKAEDKVAALCSSTHQFCNFPCLGGTVTDVRVVGFSLIGRVKLA